MKKWVEIKPIGYIGLVIALIGWFGPSLFNIHNALIKYASILIAIIGVYLLFKGRKEH
jgi:putative Mn2+ efflux pump MntP